MEFGTAPYVVMTAVSVSKVVQGSVNGSANKELSDVIQPILSDERLGVRLFDAVHRTANHGNPVESITANTPVLIAYETADGVYSCGLLRVSVFQPNNKSGNPKNGTAETARAFYEKLGIGLNADELNDKIRSYVESQRSPVLAVGNFLETVTLLRRDGRTRYELGDSSTKRLKGRQIPDVAEETDEVVEVGTK